MDTRHELDRQSNAMLGPCASKPERLGPDARASANSASTAGFCFLLFNGRACKPAVMWPSGRSMLLASVAPQAAPARRSVVCRKGDLVHRDSWATAGGTYLRRHLR